jgi:hypothetical protein
MAECGDSAVGAGDRKDLIASQVSSAEDYHSVQKTHIYVDSYLGP